MLTQKLKNYMLLVNKYGLHDVLQNRNLKKKRSALPEIAKKEIDNIHKVDTKILSSQKKIQFKNMPRISVLTPLYNTSPKHLAEMINSVIEQTYSNWELCLVDGSDSNHDYVHQICKEYCLKESRIIYKKIENKGIAENTNESVRLASGDYYALLDHDDLLHPSALYEVVKIINNFKADFIYTDEVKFRDNPTNIDRLNLFNFKLGYGLDELRSHNYICHLAVFNSKLINCTSIFQNDYEGSQDHDLFLRLTKKAKVVKHIDKVLYYWRMHEDSVSMNLNSKEYCIDSSIKAIQDDLERSLEKGIVKTNDPFKTIYRIDYSVNLKVNITIIIYGHASKAIRKKMEKNIKNNMRGYNYEIFFLDTGNQKTIEKGNSGINLSSQINTIISSCSNEYIFIMHSGCLLNSNNTVRELLMHAQRKGVFSVSGKILKSDTSIYYAGVALDKTELNLLYFWGKDYTMMDDGYEAMLRYLRNVSVNSMYCTMFTKSNWMRVNGFENIKGYEDIFFTFKGNELGMRNVWTPYAEFKLIKDIDVSPRYYDTSSFLKRASIDDPYFNFKLKKYKLL